MTTFRIPKGIYYYKLISFRLKNVGATYQRTIKKVFADMLYKHVEYYVDNRVVKYKRRDDLVLFSNLYYMLANRIVKLELLVDHYYG